MYFPLNIIGFTGAIFIHTFGAYFGLIAISMIIRKKDFNRSEHLEGSNYNSDIFACIGTGNSGFFGQVLMLC